MSALWRGFAAASAAACAKELMKVMSPQDVQDMSTIVAGSALSHCFRQYSVPLIFLFVFGAYQSMYFTAILSLYF
jgi:hypothetical protein